MCILQFVILITLSVQFGKILDIDITKDLNGKQDNFVKISITFTIEYQK